MRKREARRQQQRKPSESLPPLLSLALLPVCVPANDSSPLSVLLSLALTLAQQAPEAKAKGAGKASQGLAPKSTSSH